MVVESFDVSIQTNLLKAVVSAILHLTPATINHCFFTKTCSNCISPAEIAQLSAVQAMIDIIAYAS